MLQTWIHRIKPEQEARLRDWLAELTTRPEELHEALRAAGVRAEQAWVVSTGGDVLLIYVSEVEDAGLADRAFATSTLAIDQEHRRVMAECVLETLQDAPAYDSRGMAPTSAG